MGNKSRFSLSTKLDFGRTKVWFAISNDISASMLVLPKYARFLTSKVWMSGRAEPSSTWNTNQWFYIETWLALGHTNLPKKTWRKLPSPWCLSRIIFCRSSSIVTGRFQHRFYRIRNNNLTFLKTDQGDRWVLQVYLAQKIHVWKALHDLCLPF